MIIIRSAEYDLVSFDAEQNLWRFEKSPEKIQDSGREILMVERAKYVDSLSRLCYYLGVGGTKVLSPFRLNK